jgi:hypothetical protein
MPVHGAFLILRIPLQHGDMVSIPCPISSQPSLSSAPRSLLLVDVSILQDVVGIGEQALPGLPTRIPHS